MGKSWLLEGKKIGNEGGDIIRCDIMKYGWRVVLEACTKLLF